MPNTKVNFNRVAPGVFAQAGLILGAAYTKDYAQLVGKTVERVLFQANDEGPRAEPQPIIEFTGGLTAVVYCDPEGNGPGHLEIIKT
jgi:hypothetical protein